MHFDQVGFAFAMLAQRSSAYKFESQPWSGVHMSKEDSFSEEKRSETSQVLRSLHGVVFFLHTVVAHERTANK